MRKIYKDTGASQCIYYVFRETTRIYIHSLKIQEKQNLKMFNVPEQNQKTPSFTDIFVSTNMVHYSDLEKVKPILYLVSGKKLERKNHTRELHIHLINSMYTFSLY